MKKTLTVNIRGIVFHIDEDAYYVLNDYLNSIRRHFAREEGGDEIFADIETRIAEMLGDRIGDSKQVITLEDVEAVIGRIGQPDEFGEDFSEEKQKTSTNYQSQKIPKRFFRDPDNTIIAGICGGLGAYFHTDPLWFRILFIIGTFVFAGTPVLIYLILWVVVPDAKTAADRLSMKGEPVNLSNIENNIGQEINNLKNKFNNFTRGRKRNPKK